MNISKSIEQKYLLYNVTKKNLKSEKTKLVKHHTMFQDTKQAKEIAQVVAHALQQRAHKQLAGVVSLCLHSVFGDEYTFRIDFEMNRGRTEAKLVLIKDGHDIHDPLNNDSGGVADVASFALRLSCLMLTKPHRRKLIVLDEPFKFVSDEYKPALVELLEKLATDLNFQIVMVTHDQAYQIGKVVNI